MHILIDIRLLGRGGLSGIEEYTHQIVKNLLTQNPEHAYTLFYNGIKTDPLPFSWTSKKNVSVLNWHIPNKIIDIGARVINFPKVDAHIRPDIIWSPHFNILASTHIPRVITFHDLSFIHHPDFFRVRQRTWHWLQNYKEQAHRARLLIADSYFTKSDIINHLDVTPEKVAVVYPGIHSEMRLLSKDDAQRIAFRKKYNITYPFLLYLGTLEPRKNIPTIIRSFSQIKSKPQYKHLKLILAGKPGWLYQEILKTAQMSLYRDDIIFWGPVKDEERKLLYNEASVFVYPSFFEGFGFPPLEAQSCGCPVVVGDRTSLPEIIDTSGLSVNPWSIDELTSAILNILENELLRISLIKAGLENVKKFTWKKTTDTILEYMKHIR